MTSRIVQISDTHISIDFPQRMNDLENCVRAINALEAPPDLVIHTGDVSHDGLPREYHDARQLLDQLDAPYFVMVGNRDKRAELLEEFADRRYRFPAGGWVQYSIEQESARLLVVDTLCENSNKGQLCAERLRHLETMLLADTTKPTSLFLHHPPFEAVGIPDPFQYENWSDVENLAALLSRFANIRRLYCGHVHRFMNGEIAGIRASTISCLAGDLRKGTMSDADRKLPVFRTLTSPA